MHVDKERVEPKEIIYVVYYASRFWYVGKGHANSGRPPDGVFNYCLH